MDGYEDFADDAVAPPAWVRPPRRWPVPVAFGLVVALLVVGAVLGVTQAHRLSSTRGTLTAVRAEAATQQQALAALSATVSSTATKVSAQQQTISGLTAKLSTTGSQLTATQTELQAAQTRLQADEERLNVTTSQLLPDLTALAKQVSPSVMLIACTTATGGDTGTAFALALPAAPGFSTTIITAEHVIDACRDPADGSVISLARGTEQLEVQLRLSDAVQDVAILDTTATIPALRPAAAPVVGEFLMAVGNPLGLATNVTSGNVSQISDLSFLHSAPTSPGNSGGPVVDRSGNAVGIVDAEFTAGSSEAPAENLNVALRLSALCVNLLSGAQCDELH
jgi:S1-C subfamily serine protease